jgi:hypothetical protein
MMYIEGTCGDLWSCNEIYIYAQRTYANALLDTEQVEILRNVER